MFLPSNITLKFGDSGNFVAELQRRLAMVKCFSDDQVNGFYDGSTVNGVMQFQGMSGLHADGVAGPETLRRLNGVIAGDTSSSGTSAQEEEEKKRLATEANALPFGLAQQQQNEPAMWGAPAEPPREEAPAVSAPHIEPLAAAGMVAATVPTASPLEMAERARIDQQVSQNPLQDLTALLRDTQQVSQQIAAREGEQLSARQQAMLQQQPPTVNPALQTEPLQGPPPQALPQEPRVFKPDPEMIETQPQPASLMQRAGRFANAMIQKLADYFEAKLPPSVLNEVQSIGSTMAKAGLREAPIPTGPENVRAPEAPARGPEQQPQQIR